jgi:cytochrome c556
MKVRTLTVALLLVVVAGTISLIGDARTNELSASKLADAAPEPVEESMHEFMEYVFQPTYRRLKASMAAQPKDKSAWKPIKADSLILAEGGNLLLMRTPDEGGAAWDKFSVAVRGAGAELYQAARARDYKAAKQKYASMLDNCNACHKQFADGKYQLEPYFGSSSQITFASETNRCNLDSSVQFFPI